MGGNCNSFGTTRKKFTLILSIRSICLIALSMFGCNYKIQSADYSRLYWKPHRKTSRSLAAWQYMLIGTSHHSFLCHPPEYVIGNLELQVSMNLFNYSSDWHHLIAFKIACEIDYMTLIKSQSLLHLQSWNNARIRKVGISICSAVYKAEFMLCQGGKRPAVTNEQSHYKQIKSIKMLCIIVVQNTISVYKILEYQILGS